jgi:hypothetical protein
LEDADVDDDGIPDQIELMKVQLQKEKIKSDIKLKEKQLTEQIRAYRVAEAQKEKEIAIKKKAANKPVNKVINNYGLIKIRNQHLGLMY